MTSNTAGKLVNGALNLTGKILLATGSIITVGSLIAQRFGPVSNSIFAAIVVYLAALVLTRRFTGPGRIGTMIGAALGGYFGGLVYPAIGGWRGEVLGGLLTGALCCVGMVVGYLAVGAIATHFLEKKRLS